MLPLNCYFKKLKVAVLILAIVTEKQQKTKQKELLICTLHLPLGCDLCAILVAVG